MVTGLGFATVGVRGATDGLAVDLLLGSFEHACGGIGGFCAGRQDLVDANPCNPGQTTRMEGGRTIVQCKKPVHRAVLCSALPPSMP